MRPKRGDFLHLVKKLFRDKKIKEWTRDKNFVFVSFPYTRESLFGKYLFAKVSFGRK